MYSIVSCRILHISYDNAFEQQETAMQNICLITTSSGGSINKINFPLHQETRSVEAISKMATSMLDCISEIVDERIDVSDGDILQAISIVSAIRGNMINIDSKVIKDLLAELIENNYSAVTEAQNTRASD